MVGSITDAFGLTNNKGEEKAAKAAAQAADRSYALTEEQVKFNREQYSDWKDIYGDLQENLGNYFKDLGEDKIMSLGLTNQQKEYQAARMEVTKEIAQRGLTGSGIETDVLASGAFQNATARATIRSTAEDTVQQKKLAFLGIGLGQGGAYLGGVNQAYSTGVAGATNISGQQTNAMLNFAKMNSDAMGEIIGVGAGFLKPPGKK
jgi:hypothetical protein